jgi:sec-independent protein translocase protein TatB
MLVVALVVVGPKDLPRMMHMAGKWAGKARAMANEFRKSFDEMARQAELDELRKEIEDLKNNNPISAVTDEINDLNRTIDSAVAVGDVSVPSAEAPPAEAAPVEPAPEPRSGEFNITEAPRSGEFETTQAPPEIKSPAAAEIEPPLP